MKILYGVQSTGRGHISRSGEVIRAFKARGHDVHVLFSGPEPTLDDGEREIFEPFVVLRGLTFVITQGRIDYFKTAVNLEPLQFYHDILTYDAAGFDLVVTDFEPISARIARLNNIPSVGIGHQYAFLYEIPRVVPDPFSLIITNEFAAVDHPLGLHWHHFDQPILPPIIPASLEAGSVVADKILVYLPYEDKASVARALRSIETHQFYIYDRIEQADDRGNLHYRPRSRAGFLADLMDCSGVICHAGFTLPSEALHLGKRILAKPIVNHIEQESNALALSQLGLGQVTQDLNEGCIEKWLNASPPRAMNYPDVAELIAEWIESGRWCDVLGLAQLVWNAA